MASARLRWFEGPPIAARVRRDSPPPKQCRDRGSIERFVNPLYAEQSDVLQELVSLIIVHVHES